MNATAIATMAPAGPQYMRALERANQVRLARAELKRRVAVGEFDGVHVGHREVIRGNDTVLTFEPHPLQVVRPEAAPKLLTSLEQELQTPIK